MISFEMMLLILEIVGTVAFSISGAMIAIDEELDLFGVIFMGIITSMGGGILRDILIGKFPANMFGNYRCIIASVVTSALVFLIAYMLREYYRKNTKLLDGLNNIFDAIGLGVFTVTAIEMVSSMGFGYNKFLLLVTGMTTGVGGGMIRDIIVLRKPMIFTKHIYAVASLIGGWIYLKLLENNMSNNISIVFTISVIFAIRMLATVYNWNLPKIDLNTTMNLKTKGKGISK